MGSETNHLLGRSNLSAKTILAASKDQCSCDLGGESVIVHLQSGFYYDLNPIGSEVWNIIQKPSAVSEICDAILQRYDVGLEQCESDLLCLLQQLLDEGLIEVRDATAD